MAQIRGLTTFNDVLFALRGDKLYVNDYNFGLRIFDVSDPRRPRQLGGVPVAADHFAVLVSTSTLSAS